MTRTSRPSANMPLSFLHKLSHTADFYLATRAPLKTYGAQPPETGVTEKYLTKAETLFKGFASLDGLALVDALKNRNTVGMDDRKLLLEELVEFMAILKDEEISRTAQRLLLNSLYNDLPHPPSNYLAPYPLQITNEIVPQGPIKYAYRTADGSFNNPLIPTLGQAGAPYARSVTTANISPKRALPDPGLVFDSLLRRDKFEEHPGGISSLFFAFADLVIHSIFYTDHKDWTKNKTSSYLDLSILYGSNQKQQDSVRRKDGSGRLYDDVFADGRLLMMPPATCALLVLFSRNHNFIAQRLLDINENGNFKAVPNDEEKSAQDDELFHRSRLVNCGYFMKIILGDYVGAILGLVKHQSSWRLDPLMTMRESSHELSPTGQGNVVSIEFNLLYRWHAALSQPDTEWTTRSFSHAFPGKDISKVTIEEFNEAASRRLSNTSPPTQWEFGGLKRDKSNRFKDEDLANILQSATEAPAAAFKARGIPESLRVIEILGIEQSRTWRACSLNEFRKFLGLKPYKSFKDWNPNQDIYTAAASLYRDIDNLELYVGLQAEETKSPRFGAGLCPGYTISRAILADAVALTRGDRYMTTEFNPYNLTSWGYQDCQHDEGDGSYGGMLTKLLFRSLPQYYPRRSAYAHFPFLTPKSMEPHMMENDPSNAAEYIWSRPVPPRPTYSIGDYNSVERILSDSSPYLSSYDSQKFTIVQPTLMVPKKVMLNKGVKEFDRNLREEELLSSSVEAAKIKLTTGSSSLHKAIFTKPTSETATYFAEKTRGLINAKSFSLVHGQGKNVDIVKDVINLLPIHWICHILGLPLKSEDNPRGAWGEESTWEDFANISRYVYLNFDATDDWKMRESAQTAAERIIKVIEAHVNKNFPLDLLDHSGMRDSYGHVFLEKLWHVIGTSQDSYREFATQVFTAVVPTAALYSQYVAQVVDFYLDNDRKATREEIVKLVASADPNAAAKVMAYVNEALRLRPPVPGVYRTAARDDILDSVELKSGSHVFASIADANSEVSSFGHAGEAVRTAGKPIVTDFGAKGLLTSEFFKLTVPATLGAIFSLNGLERGAGNSGMLISFKEDMNGTKVVKYINLQGLISPWADSLTVQFI